MNSCLTQKLKAVNLRKPTEIQAQLDIMEIHCANFQIIPMENIRVTHKKSCKRTDGWTNGLITL